MIREFDSGSLGGQELKTSLGLRRKMACSQWHARRGLGFCAPQGGLLDSIGVGREVICGAPDHDDAESRQGHREHRYGHSRSQRVETFCTPNPIQDRH
jgi:hypothetical protein